MHEASVIRNGDFVIFDFRASGFLHHMVRNLVGSLLQVGLATWSPQQFSDVIDARDRTRAAATFSAEGLYFVGAEYESCWRLPEVKRIIATFDPLHL